MTTWGQCVGMDIHSGATAYADISKVKAGLSSLGVTMVRDNSAGGPAKLGSSYRTIVVIDTLDIPTAQARVDQAIAGGAWMIECFNEPTSAQAAAAKAVNEVIIARVAGRVPVMASALALPNPSLAAAIGPNPKYDYASAHPYRSDLTMAQFTSRVNAMKADGQVMAPNRPFYVTETGFWVADSNPQNFSHHPTTQANAVSQLRPNLDMMFSAGAEGVIYYELFFEPGVSVEYERKFGWINADGSLTPWAEELAGWMAQYGSIDRNVPCTGSSAPAHDPDDLAQIQALQAQLVAANGLLTSAQASQSATASRLATAEGVIRKAQDGNYALGSYSLP